MNKEREGIFIGLGSNLGDKIGNIERALFMLGDLPGTEIISVAPFYGTAPVGYTKQEWFVNTVSEVKTSLQPGKLLAAILDVENIMGRERQIRWGPRVIDLDLLLYGQREICEPGLEVPHPRMLERAFVMVPLADLAPQMLFSGGRRAKEIAAELEEQQEIKLLERQA